jgi:hypothetical protein
MSLAQLSNIYTAVREYTRSPSEAQLSTQQLNDFVNIFLLYDMPSDLRLFSQRKILDFYTQPGVDQYSTTTTDPLDPLYNFQNVNISVHPQVFIAGVPASFTQYRDVFYGQWPQTNAVVNTGLQGNGTAGPYQGIVNTALQAVTPPSLNQPQILQKSVIFTLLDENGTAMVLVDTPYNNNNGYLAVPNAVPTALVNNGTVNYQTGIFSITFPNIAANANAQYPNILWCEYVPYVLGKPIAMLYFANTFTIRPVPDKAYQVQVEVDVRPTELIQTTDTPELEQWWQYIAVGTAIKILQRRLDMESVQLLMPLFQEQKNFVNRTSLMQTANMRSETIYTVGLGNNWGWFGSNWPSY